MAGLVAKGLRMRPEDRLPGGMIALGLLGLLTAWLLVTWLVPLLATIRQGRNGAHPITPGSEPPKVSPALAGYLANHPDGSIVASVLLDLAVRKKIEVEAHAAGGYLMRLPKYDEKQADRFAPSEDSVLSAVRNALGGSIDGRPEVVGPDLWTGLHYDLFQQFFASALAQEAQKAGLLEDRPTTFGFMAAPLVGGFLTIYALKNNGAGLLLMAGAFVGAGAISTAGAVLSEKGRELRTATLAYAAHLRDQKHLLDAVPLDVTVHGKALAYAASLGAAPKAARALSPDWERS